MSGMSGILRQLGCFCFLGLMVGSLWLFAASGTVPSIPPWRDEDQQKLTVQRPELQTTAAAVPAAPLHAPRFDHDLDIDVDDTTAATAAFDDDDDESELGRRST